MSPDVVNRPTGKFTERLFRALVLTGGALNIWFQILIWFPQQWRRTDYDRDMAIYYRAAAHLKSGTSMYWTIPPSYGPDQVPLSYLYSPHLAAALTPFVGHYLVYSRSWYVLMIVSFWSFAYVLGRLSIGASSKEAAPAAATSLFATFAWSIVLALCPCVYAGKPFATYPTMSIGNIDPALWALFAAAIAFGGSQTILGTMALVKPYAAVPWLVYTVSRGWRSAVPSAIVVVVGTGVTLALGAVTPFIEWLTKGLPLAAQSTFYSGNWSLSFAVLRILRALHVWHYSHGPLAQGPHLYLTSMAILGPVVVAIVTRAWETRARAMVLFMAALLFSPLCWSTYYMYGLVPIACRRGGRRTLAKSAGSRVIPVNVGRGVSTLVTPPPGSGT